jgi:putative superfamily III holin-X
MEDRTGYNGKPTIYEAKPGIMELVSGILRDATDIISKEVMAAKLEMRAELDKAKSIAVLMGVGAVALLVGTILLAFTLVYLLQEFSGLDLWACYAIITVVFCATGLIILLMGKRRAAATNLVPTESIEKAKEDARWITRSVKYETR